MANHKTKILVADDERVIANSLAAILKQTGYDVRTANSGEMAVEIARDFRPDKLVSDVFMTGITGIEVALQVRAMLPSCQILLFSGQVQTTDLTNGEFDLLCKPIDPADLLARLRTGTYLDSRQLKRNECENRI